MNGPLLGSGVLAIWNGMKPGHDAAFLRWHVSEHIPERLSVPGFLRGRRYAAVSAQPRYFNFYEVASPEVLKSEAYLARLDDPSEWTRSVVPNFTDTSRTLCSVVRSHGHGVSGFICALALTTPADGMTAIFDNLTAADDVTAVHLLDEAEGKATATAESRMRSAPDQTAAGILLVEGVDREALDGAVSNLASDQAIADATGAPPFQRGTYQLDFMMDRARNP